MTFFVTMLCILLGVAYYTLLERKILGYLQIRLGPNKVGPMGVFQPLADAVKLFVKEEMVPHKSNRVTFVLSPLLSLLLAMLLWNLLPSSWTDSTISLGILLFLCLSSMNVYCLLLGGWSSNSKYAMLGSLRASAQSISYEVSLFLIVLFSAYLNKSYNLDEFSENSFPILYLFLPMALVWFTTTLAETNRAPFDFAEGESELVSGFNIEYGGGFFALLFMAEYANMLFMSVMTTALFLGYVGVWKCLTVASFMLLVRGAYPRHRYDLLMMLCWKSFLPISLCSLLLILI